MPFAVLYATREGQTRHIAQHVAARLRSHGLTVELEHVSHLPLGFSLAHHAGAILAASVHMGEHEREMVKFVKRHRTELEQIPSTFLSVSLTEAGVERETTPPARKTQSEADVRAMIEAFIAETGWRPHVARPVAGALQFSRYGLVTRFVMRAISRKLGGDTDTSRDYEYTDWPSLDVLVDDIAEEAAGDAPQPASSSAG